MRLFETGRSSSSPRALLLLVSVFVALVVYFTGAGAGAERGLHSMRDTLRTHSASGSLVLVEIDAKSLKAIDEWPWPRSVHGRALRMLERAGASTVAFDVDFSSHSVADEDAQFAAAIEQASIPIILPTFRQYASQRSTQEIESLPLPAFRRHAQLAAVNIFSDSDGFVRNYPAAVTTGGIPRPSIGAMLAGATGKVGTTFPIDTAIDPGTIPHISYGDLIAGRVPAGALKGRSVLIGASAIELGDRYPIPRWGIIPGPAIQLLAAETLLAGSSPISRGPWIPLAATFLLLMWACSLRNRQQTALLMAVGALNLLIPLLMEMLHWGTVEVMPALAMVFAGGAWLGVTNAVASFNHLRGTDPSSGLPNRRALEGDLALLEEGQAIIAARIGGYGDVASLLGQERGAELILRIVDRLKSFGVDTVYRLEENTLAFSVSASKVTPPDHFFEQVALLLQPPIEIAARQVQLDYAFGRAMLDDTRVSIAIDHSLLAADQAQDHGHLWYDHSIELEGSRDWRLSLAGELDNAMAAGDIWVAFQPKLHIAKNSIEAAEALVRWRHPERGDIYPDAFIPQLEASGRIMDLTLYVLDRAMESAQAWEAGGNAINVAVNVSPLLLIKTEFVNAIHDRLTDGRLSPALLTLEITESASLEDRDRALDGMKRFAEMGIDLSIDDYGTGQSTLSYLKHLPAREIKIDKSFILAIEENRSDLAMVRSTISLAHELGFQVVAEGVENEMVLSLLREIGCDYAQGWYIGRPIPAEEFIKLVGAPLAA